VAYDKNSLTRVEGAPGQALYRYRTTDTLTAIVASGYFNDAVTGYNLDTGDVIIATTGANGAAAVDLLVVTNTNGTAAVVNGT
jgi:hypothetical protein